MKKAFTLHRELGRAVLAGWIITMVTTLEAGENLPTDSPMANGVPLAGSEFESGSSTRAVRPLRDNHRASKTFHAFGAPSRAPMGGETGMGQQVILTRKQDGPPQPFYLFTNFGIGWTDNVALTDLRQQSDTYLNASADLIYRPLVAAHLYGDIELSYNAYRYDKNSSLDTDEQDALVGLIKTIPEWGDLNLFAHYSYDRLVEGGGQDELYSSHGIRIGLDKTWYLTGRQSLYTRIDSKFSVDAPTESSLLQRDEYNLILAYQIRPVENLDAEAFYQLQYYDFHNGGREDLSHTLGISLTYHLNEYAAITGSISGTINDSNARGEDYEAIDGGASLTLQFNF